MRNVGVNPWLLCVFHGFQMTLLPMAIITLFWKHQSGMTVAEILLLQGLGGLFMAIFELPSGYLADRIGYRKSLIWASLILAVGWSIYCIHSSFGALLIAGMIMAFGLSLISGCDTALLYESLCDMGQEEEFGRWEGFRRFCGQSCEGGAALVAGVLFTYWVRLPFVLQAILCLVNAIVAFSLVEPSRQKPLHKGNHLRQIRSMLSYAFVEHRHLTALICLTVAFSLSSFIPVWLVQIYAMETGVDPSWLGPIWAVANYSVALGALLSSRFERRIGLIPSLLVCIALMALGYFGMGLTYAAFGFLFYYSFTLMRGLYEPVLMHQEHRLIPSSNRAGMISLRSLTFRFSFFLVGPLVGFAVDATGMHNVLLMLGSIFMALTSAGCYWLRSHGQPQLKSE